MNENMNGIMIQELSQKIADEIAKNILCNQTYGVLESMQGDNPLHLDNCTGNAQSAPEGGYPMAHERIRVPVDVNERGQYVTRFVSGNNDVERALNCVQLMYNSGFLHKTFPGWFSFQHEDSVLPKEEPVKAKTKVSAYFNSFYERYIKGQVAVTYQYQFEMRVERISRYFDEKGLCMEDVTTDHAQDFFNEHKNLSHTTLKDWRGTMKRIFNYAAKQGIVQERAIDWAYVTNPGHKRKSRKAATVKQHEDILDHLCDLIEPVEQLAVSILAYTGIRPEELLALRWEDIDFDAKRINIQRAVVYPGRNYEGKKSGHAVLKDTKSEYSADWIPLVDGLENIMLQHRKSSGWIIHDQDGNIFETYQDWRKVWKQAGENIELYGLNVCEFRKTMASVLIAKGVDVKSVQRLLRHANADITINTYAEVDEDTFIASCSAIEKRGA